MATDYMYVRDDFACPDVTVVDLLAPGSLGRSAVRGVFSLLGASFTHDTTCTDLDRKTPLRSRTDSLCVALYHCQHVCSIVGIAVQGRAGGLRSEAFTCRSHCRLANFRQASEAAWLPREQRSCGSYVRRLDGEDMQGKVGGGPIPHHVMSLTGHSGFDFILREVDREDLEDTIRHANTDDDVDGMIVYYPVFDSRRDQTLQWTVSMYKDVEGLSPQLISNMYQNIRFLDPPVNTRKSILPCTPLAVIKILEYLQIYNTFLDYGKRLFGRRITVINRSEVVGRPLAALLANDGAEVYSVDVTGVQHFSRGSGLRKQRHEVRDMEGWGLEQCLPISDVVISGVPGDQYKVPTNLIREGAVCINFSSEKVCHSGHRYKLAVD